MDIIADGMIIEQTRARTSGSTADPEEFKQRFLEMCETLDMTPEELDVFFNMFVSYVKTVGAKEAKENSSFLISLMKAVHNNKEIVLALADPGRRESLLREATDEDLKSADLEITTDMIADFLKDGVPTLEETVDTFGFPVLVYLHNKNKNRAFEKLSSSKIKSFELMNDKLTRIMETKLPEITEQNGAVKSSWGIRQSPAGARNTVSTFLELSFSSDSAIKPERPLTFYDNLIQSAIAAIIVNQIRNGGTLPVTFTAKEVWRIMNGIQSEKDRKPGEAELERINASILKMRNIDVLIDCREEINKQSYEFDGELVKGGTITARVVNADYGTFLLGNRQAQKNVFRIFDIPAIWHYNKMKRHTIAIPSEVLKTIDHTGTSGNTTPFKFYILNRIENMKSGNLNNRTIRFSSLYEETGTPSPEERLDRSKYKDTATYSANIRKQRAKDRKTVSDILEALAKKRYISGYEVTKTPSGEDSVLICLNAADQARLDEIRKEHEEKKLKAK